MLKLCRCGTQKIETIHRRYDNNLETCNPVGTGWGGVGWGQNMRQFSELQMSFCFERCVFTSWLGPIPCKSLSLSFFFLNDCLWTHHPLVSEKKASKIRKMTFVFSVGLSSVFLTQVKRSRAASSMSHLSPHVSHFQSLQPSVTPTAQFRRWSPSRSRPGCRLQ